MVHWQCLRIRGLQECQVQRVVDFQMMTNYCLLESRDISDLKTTWQRQTISRGLRFYQKAQLQGGGCSASRKQVKNSNNKQVNDQSNSKAGGKKAQHLDASQQQKENQCQEQKQTEEGQSNESQNLTIVVLSQNQSQKESFLSDIILPEIKISYDKIIQKKSQSLPSQIDNFDQHIQKLEKLDIFKEPNS